MMGQGKRIGQIGDSEGGVDKKRVSLLLYIIPISSLEGNRLQSFPSLFCIVSLPSLMLFPPNLPSIILQRNFHFMRKWFAYVGTKAITVREKNQNQMEIAICVKCEVRTHASFDSRA